MKTIITILLLTTVLNANATSTFYDFLDRYHQQQYQDEQLELQREQLQQEKADAFRDWAHDLAEEQGLN
jgi:hypothetical protein